MAKISFVIFFFFISSKVLAFGADIRPSNLSAIYIPQSQLTSEAEPGQRGQHILAKQLLANLNRYIVPCLKLGCGLSQEESATLSKILQIVTSNSASLYFARDMQDLFSQLDSTTQEQFKTLGFLPDKKLFDLPQYKTHRIAVSSLKPGPIIFNQEFFETATTSLSGAEILTYLIHELGHQTGLGYESEAFLDRLSLKISQITLSRGGEASNSSSNFRLWTDNYVNINEYSQFTLAEIGLNNVGQVIIYSDSTYLNLSRVLVTANINWIDFDFIYTGFVWVGTPSFEDVRTFKDLGTAQILKGTAIYFMIQKDMQSYVPIYTQYELRIPVVKNSQGTWQYTNGKIVATLFDVHLPTDEVVSPDNLGYEVLSAHDFVMNSLRGLKMTLQCPQKPQDVALVLKMNAANEYRSTDLYMRNYFSGKFIAQKENTCEYFFAVKPSEIQITASADVEQVYVVTAEKKNLLLPTPNPLTFHYWGLSQNKNVNVMFTENLFSWAYFDENDKTWHAVEKIDTSGELNKKYLDDPRFRILWELDFKIENSVFCGGSISFTGLSKNFPRLAEEVTLGDVFPEPVGPKNRIFEHSDITYKNDSQYQVVSILNSFHISKQLMNPSINYFSFVTCSQGPLYFDYAYKDFP